MDVLWALDTLADHDSVPAAPAAPPLELLEPLPAGWGVLPQRAQASAATTAMLPASLAGQKP